MAGFPRPSSGVPVSQTQPASGVAVPLWTVQPHAAGAAAFSEFVTNALFAGVEDPLLFQGYNAALALAGEPVLREGFESDYKAVNWAGSGLTELTMEWYLEYQSPDHATVVNLRPVAFTLGRNNNADRWATVQLEIGTDVSAFRSRLIVVGQAAANPASTTLFSITNNQADFFDTPVEVHGAPIYLDSTADPPGGNAHLFFLVDGVLKYYYGNFRGDPNHYLWDQARGNFQVAYTFGGAGGTAAALTEFQSAVKVDGGLNLNNAAGAGGANPGPTIYGGTGAPNNANGVNGDVYVRTDGAALSFIYQRRAGVWTGLI